jgi:hypothetical protein
VRLSEDASSKNNISSLYKVVSDSLEVTDPRHVFSLLLSDLSLYRNIQLLEFLKDSK